MNMVQRGKQNATFGDPEFHDSRDFTRPFHAGNQNKSRFQVWLYYILRLFKVAGLCHELSITVSLTCCARQFG